MYVHPVCRKRSRKGKYSRIRLAEKIIKEREGNGTKAPYESNTEPICLYKKPKGTTIYIWWNYL